MSEQKVFDVFSEFELKELAEDLANWFKEEKKLEAEALPTEDGYIVQAKTKAGFKKLVGMDQALQVQLKHDADKLVADIGAAKWVDKAKKGTLRTLIFTPLAVTSAIGAWQQSKIPNQVFEFIEFCITQYLDEKICAELNEGNWEKAAILADKGINTNEDYYLFYYYKACALGGQSLFDEALKLNSLAMRVFKEMYDDIAEIEKSGDEADEIKNDYVLIKSKEAELYGGLNSPYDSIWSYNEAYRYESSLSKKELYKTRIDEAYKKLAGIFSGLDYKRRKVFCVNDVLPGKKPDSFVILNSQSLPEIKFSPGHPVEGELYVGHPYRGDVYFPFTGYEQELFQDKEMELTYLLQCLGAESIEIRMLKEETVKDSAESSSQREAKLEPVKYGLEAESKSLSKSNRRQSEKKEVSIVQTFSPKKKPFVPADLTWYDHELVWQRLARQRLDGNILDSKIEISTEAVQVINENEKKKIKTELEYLGLHQKFENESEKSSKMDGKSVMKREIYVKFAPIDELSEVTEEPVASEKTTEKKEVKMPVSLSKGGNVSLSKEEPGLNTFLGYSGNILISYG